MARSPRVELPHITQHIIQRGNNRQPCFVSEQDFTTYLDYLEEYSKQFEVNIHAWVLMTNHVHLLCTPIKSKGVSCMMQSIGRRYVRYFNKKHHRTGTLWEGRYKSCLVQSNNYLLQLYLYIELNPVRAAMVADPSLYIWSSYKVNALGEPSDLCTPHQLYLSIGLNNARCQAYQALFKPHLDDKLLSDIRQSLNKGLALGNTKFKEQIEKLSGCRVTEGKRGRPISLKKQIT